MYMKKLNGSLFSFQPQVSQRQRQVSGSTNELDIHVYLSEGVEDSECDPSKYWNLNSKKFPALSKLAQTYLSLPATPAPVERLFSVGGKIF